MLQGIKATFAVLLVASVVVGCTLFTTKKEGRELERKVAQMEDRVAEMEASITEEREYLTEMIDRARTEVDKLEETLNRATRILARNSADYGAEIDTIKDKLRETDGLFAELRHDLGEMDKSVKEVELRMENYAIASGLDIPVDESNVPSREGDHFAMIKESYNAEKWGEARSLCKLFIARYPGSSNADDAKLIMGKTYIEQKRWAKALGELRQFTDTYPKSKLTAEALYEMARSFYFLGHCTDARILIEAVTTRHRRSAFAKKAKSLAAKIKKNKSRCTS